MPVPLFYLPSFLPAISSICTSIAHIKKEEIEISITNVFSACAIGHSTMLFTQAASIFNINDITCDRMNQENCVIMRPCD